MADPARGWAASFNEEPAKPSRVNCGTSDPSAGGQLTVSAWLYWRGTNGNWQGSAGKSLSYDNRRWILQLRDTDGMIQWGSADNANLHIFSTAAPRADEWQHVVGTCDGTTSRVYINGAIVGEGAGRFAPGADTANVTLGFGEDRSDYDESFNGMLDQIHILTRGLSSDQIQALAKGVVPAFTGAREPNPGNGATAVQMPLFHWTAGDGARFHNVYLGTTAELGAAQLVSPRSVLAMYYHTAPLEPGKTYYWRVDEIDPAGAVQTGDVWSFVAQALTAYHPNPADGAVDAAPTPLLTWLPGQTVTKHHVYFGDSGDAVGQGATSADKGEVKDPNFAPGALENLTTYYWRVGETAAGGAVRTGPVWKFSTCLSVDDFEGYTDDLNAKTTIFDTWIDGFTNGLSGSMVGNETAPFGEQKIVHSGKQSMPMDYNNVKSPFYSEAEREFAPTQDWTANAPAQLYLAVEDTSKHVGIVTYADQAVTSATPWTQWKVPLSSFAGVNLAKVKKLYIGVGDKKNSAAGGSGRIYVDDIQVTK